MAVPSTKKIVKGADPLEENEAFQKIIHWFFSYPTREVGLNDLSHQLSIAKTTANRVVTELVEIGFLNKEVIGKIWRISCNQQHHLNLTRKIAYNLTMIYESGIIEEVHKIIPSPRAIILFGSYRKGDDIDTSDIDIGIEVFSDEKPQIMNLGVIKEFGYRKNVLVNLHVFSRNNIDLNLFSNIANGIILEGFLEVRP